VEIWFRKTREEKTQGRGFNLVGLCARAHTAILCALNNNRKGENYQKSLPALTKKEINAFVDLSFSIEEAQVEGPISRQVRTPTVTLVRQHGQIVFLDENPG